MQTLQRVFLTQFPKSSRVVVSVKLLQKARKNVAPYLTSL